MNFDNNAPELYGAEAMGEFKARVLAEGRKRNPKLIVSSNYHARWRLVGRYENAVNTEDGIEPGVFGGRLVTNAGLLRVLAAVSEGWRPVVVNYSRLQVGTPFTDVLPAAHQKLALAECQAFQAAYENFQDGKTYADLFYGERKATENWQAVGLYNAFFEAHESFYTSPESLARLAVVINAESEAKDAGFLNALAARNVIYDAVYEQDATPARLGRYAEVVAAPSVGLRAGWRRLDSIAAAELGALAPVRVRAPDSVIVNAHGQAGTKRVLVHLLNYADAPVAGIVVAVRGEFGKALLLSPDLTASVEAGHEGGFTHIRVPELRIYDLLALE